MRLTRSRILPTALMFATVSLIAAALASPVAAAGEVMQASGTVRDNAATFTVVDQDTAGGNVIQTAVVDGVIDGTFTGTYVEQARGVFHGTGEGNLKGTATCSCSVDGRSGTIVFGFDAKAEPDGSIKVYFAIVSATGALTGLHGVGTIASPDGLTGNYTAQIHF